MDSHRDARTTSASLFPNDGQRNHAPVKTKTSPSHSRVEAASRLKLKGVTRLCGALVLLVVVAIGHAGFLEAHLELSRSNPALRFGIETRASRHVVRREAPVRKVYSEGLEFDFERYDSFLNGSSTLPASHVLNEATELMHSLTQVPTDSSHVHVVGRILLESFGLDVERQDRNHDIDSRLMQDARKILLALPLPEGNGPILSGSRLQIAVLRTDDSHRDPAVALCSKPDMKSLFDNIPLSKFNATKTPLDKCNFALTLSKAGFRNKRIAIIAYPMNWIIRPLPSVGHVIYNSRVVDLAFELNTRQDLSKGLLLSLYFKPSLTLNTRKGCAYWSEERGNWTTEGCWIDSRASLDLCHCNLSKHFKENPTGGQFVVYEYSDVFLNETRLMSLKQHSQGLPAEFILKESIELMHNLTLIPDKIGFSNVPSMLSDILHILYIALRVDDRFIISNQDAVAQLVQDARINLLALPVGQDPAKDGFTLQIAVLRTEDEPQEPAVAFCSLRGKKSVFHEIPRPNLLGLKRPFDNCSFELTMSNAGFENTKIAIIAYPTNWILRPLPSIGHNIYNSRVVDVAIEPRTNRNISEDPLLSIYFKPSLTGMKGCAYWSREQNNWIADGCWIDLGIESQADICYCNMTRHFDEDATGGQYIVYEYSDTFFDEKKFLYLQKARDLPAGYVLNESIALMHNLTLLPEKIGTSNLPIMVSNILNILNIVLKKVDEDFNISNQNAITQLVRDARQNLLALPIPVGNDLFLGGLGLEFAVLQTGDKSQDPVVDLCLPRDRVSTFQKISRSNFQDTKTLFEKCYFTVTISESKLRHTKMAIIVYPTNSIIRPLPSFDFVIHNSRVAEVAIEPRADRDPSDYPRLSLYFQPSKKANTTKGCAFWNEGLGNWTTDGCWVDLGANSQTDFCHCNLSRHLNEHVTSGQYIIYEHTDVYLESSSYAYLEAHKVYVNEISAQFFIEARSLMHNLSLIPVNRQSKYILNALVSYTLDAIYDLDAEVKTNLTVQNIKNFYLDARKIIRSPVEGEGFAIIQRNMQTLTISKLIVNPSDLQNSFFFSNLHKKVALFPFNQDALRIIKEREFSYALTTSPSIAEYNEMIGYILFPVNRFIFAPMEKVDPRYQVHNFRVIDISLTPRAGGENKEDQFIDIWYQPSVFGAFVKDLRLGCAYWSERQYEWTEKGCVTHANAPIPGCRCNLTAHFNESREGGQYVVYEYSDVVLATKRIESMLENEQFAKANISTQDEILHEMTTFLHNMTDIGYIDEYGLRLTKEVMLFALTTAEGAVKSVANLSVTFTEGLRVITERWARDQTREAVARARKEAGEITKSSPVAIEAHEVLSNEAVNRNTSLLHQFGFAKINMNVQDAYIGVTLLSKTIMFMKAGMQVSDEPQISFFFTVDVKDTVGFAAVMYPESKMFLPLSETLPAIFSYHSLEVAIIIDVNTSALLQTRLVTLVHVPDGQSRSSASTACAAWTGVDWSTNTCWSDTINKHTCTCNLSAHALSVGTFLPLLIYEAIEAPNFSAKSSLSALDVFYVIFATVSMIGLVLVALTAVVFPQWRADVGHKILLHLSLALFFYQTLRLYRETNHVYTALNRDVATAFVAFTAITHYSRLAHYAWMLAMSVLQLRRLLTVVGASDIPHLLIKVSVLAWGVPLVPLIALLSWDIEVHFARPDKLTHLVLYLVPGAVVTGVNIALLVVIAARVFACFGWGMVNDLGRHGISDAKLTVRRMTMIVLLFFLFGTPTVFEMVNDLWGHSVALEVLFKVFDPVRGAVVFVYFILLDEKTFELWRQKVLSLAARSAKQELEMK